MTDPTPSNGQTGCVTVRVFFLSGDARDFPVHPGGDWRYTERNDFPTRLIVRPFGGMRQNDGEPQCRHEIPLATIESVFVVPARAKDTGR